MPTAVRSPFVNPGSITSAFRFVAVSWTIVVLLPTPAQTQAAAGPSLNAAAISALRRRAAAAGVRAVHVVLPLNTMAFNQEAELMGTSRIVIWNAAARKIYGSSDILKAQGDGALEIGANGWETYDEKFRAAGILEGLREDSLYELWPTKLVVAGTGTRASQKLMSETWMHPTDPQSFRRAYAK